MKNLSLRARNLLTALQATVLLLALAACGGGGSPETGKTADAARSVAVTEKAQGVAASLPAPSTWTLCAAENGYCSFSGTQEVIYGTTTQYFTATLTGGTACSNAVFTDPAVGIVKSCWYVPVPAGTTLWTACATEGNYCAFEGTQQVRYGTLTSSVTLALTGGTACSNAVFGDPAQGYVKTCSIPAGTPTLTACAAEGGTCAFAGVQEVTYGSAEGSVSLVLAGGTACSNAVFGDPSPGYVKSCSYGPAPSSATVWVPCANENGICNFTGAAQVRYGTVTQNVIKTFTNQTACSNTVFGDPDPGIVKACWYAESTAGAYGTNPPIVFNASQSAVAGDVVSIQGVNLGAESTVYFDGASGTPLQIVNSVGTTWLAVQIPSTAPPALVLRVSNTTGTSAPLKLNAAIPLHLDTLQLVPGGAFRVFGRNLYLAGSTPTVLVNGAPAVLDLASSDAYMLTAVAPATLAASAAATVTVDNGNGTGPATLDRKIQTLATGGTDPFGLGVGWAADFATIAANVINAATDSRLSTHVACDGVTDDSYAIQVAIDLAASTGGGVVQLPAATCHLANNFNLASNVIVQGAGKASTNLVYDANYAFSGLGVQYAGVRNLTMTNSGLALEGPILKNSSFVFIQNVKFQLNASRQMYLTGNTQFAIQGTDFVQPTSVGGQGPYNVTGSAAFLFENNTTTWSMGAPTFQQMHDAYIHANTFNHDASQLSQPGYMHSMAIDFAYRSAIIGNSFGVLNGPVTDHTRNDGETILTEGGGGSRTENLGTVTSADSTSITDTNNTIVVDPFDTGSIPEDYGVAIVGGTGAGQMRQLTAYGSSKMTVDHPWDVVPDTTSTYATFVFGLEKSVIKDNILSQNPRGIWLYQTAIRDVDLINNNISQGGGIYLRSYQNLASKYFMPIYNVLVKNNTVVNTTGNWGSYLNAVFVNHDELPFGIATLGIEVRSNQLTANIPNVDLTGEEYAAVEGFMNMMRVETYNPYVDPPIPRLLGTIFANNGCTNCAVAIRLGTGAGGTTILNQTFVNGGALLDDEATTPSTETSTGTVIR